MCDQDIELRRKRDLERYHRRTAERRKAGLCLRRQAPADFATVIPTITMAYVRGPGMIAS